MEWLFYKTINYYRVFLTTPFERGVAFIGFNYYYKKDKIDGLYFQIKDKKYFENIKAQKLSQDKVDHLYRKLLFFSKDLIEIVFTTQFY